MNNLARVLLLAGGLVLALLIGVLIGRGQAARPSQGNAAAMQIDTAPPPMAAPAPLPAPVQAATPTPPPPPAPKPAPIVQAAPDVQVQEDAAAVGMTTREGASPAGTNGESPPRTAGEPAGNSQPPG
jgi:hypothetical protein